MSCAAGVEEPPTGSSTSSGATTSSSQSSSSSQSTTSSGSTSGSTTGSSSSSGGGGGGSGGAGSTSASTTSVSVSASASSGTGGCAPYTHAIAIDGTDDFAAEEKPPTSSIDYTARITWDDTYLYVGMKGPDVASGSSTKWLLVYLSGAGGTTTGVTYNTQSPTLAFPARWHFRWRADNGYTNALMWNGAQWADAMLDFTGDVFQSGDFVEMRIPRAEIGSPATIGVHLSMINEVGGGEFTYAGLPKTSFMDAVDPNYTHWFQYDFAACDAPSMYLPQ